MRKNIVLPFLGGLGVGAISGYMLKGTIINGGGGSLPPVFASAVARLRCHDTTQNVDLIGPQIYGGGKESNDWEYYLVGYGLGTRLNDDVLIALARQGTSTNINANCVKLADDAIEVYSSNILQITMPSHINATEKQLYPAFAWFLIV
jgi:hypothetical protein